MSNTCWIVYLTDQGRWALREYASLDDGTVQQNWGRAEQLPVTWAIRCRIPLFRP